ncbi:MAG: hypothetical protein BWX86_02335 [Verrucomicrobia bacterium ADurb.Bin122]|nr:MAG: hypothetical protein BWX86_02335 [Verrucomicrobia bacterium ADurb.Bin122]
MHAADQVAQHLIDRAADFLEGFDAFGGEFAGGVVLVLAVAGGAAGLHGGDAAHAAVLFIELAVDFHDLARRLAATGEQTAAHDGVGQREGFDDVARLGDAAVGDDAHAFAGGTLAGDVEGGELRDADAGDDARGADGAGALADLDGVGATVGEVLDAGAAGHVARDDGERGERVADDAHHVAHAGGVSVGGGDGDAVHGLGDELADLGDNAVAVEGAVGLADGGGGGATEEAECGIARGFAARFGLVHDALHVGAGDEALEAVLGIDDEHFVDADVVGEEFVGAADGVVAERGVEHGEELGARGHGLDDALVAVALLDDAAGEQAEEFAVLAVDDREGFKAEALLLDEFENVADGEVGADGDRVLDEAVDVVLHAGHFLHLLLRLHVVVDEAEAAVERHRNGHLRLGDGVHVGRDDGNLEADGVRELGGGVGVLGEDVREERGQRNVVEGERGGQVCAEEGVSLEIEFSVNAVDGRRSNLCHKLPVSQ